MRDLIIVEGLPCSGKSTAAKYISDKLNMKNYDEDSGTHPADYEFHAFIQKSELKGFSRDEQDKITESSDRRAGGFILPLSSFEGDLFNKLLQYKIYDFLPWEAEMPVMLGKWREFAENKKPDERYVFNCVLLQNSMCETMIRFGFSKEQSAEYVGKIADIIRPLAPLVVYLKNDDICSSVKRAVPERGRDWLDAVVEYHCNGAYGRSMRLDGFDGYISALEERQRRELEILSGINIDYIVLDNPQRDWAAAYRKLDKALE